MHTALKVILIIGVVIVLLVGACVGVGVYWWRHHSREFIAAGRQAMDEGRAFGRQTDNDGCMAEAVARARHEQGFGAALNHNLFLRACLEASRPVPGFCSAVPARTEFMKSVRWQQQKCHDAGLAGDAYCGQLFTQVQQFCEAQQSKQQ